MTQTLGDDPMHAMMRQIMALFDEYQSKENGKHSRRNLDAYTGSVLALKLEPLMREKAKAKLVSMGKIFGKGQQKPLPMLANPIDEQKHQPALHTRAEIAKAAGVSHGTLNKVKVIEAKAAPEIKAKLAAGQTTSPTRLKIHASIAVPFWAAQDVERQAHHLLRAAQPAGEMVQDDSC